MLRPAITEREHGEGRTDTFDLSVLRPEDLLALRFRGINLVLESAPGQSPRLVRQQPAQAAFLIVELSPQHIAERAFTEGEEGELLDLRAPPIPAVLSNPSRLAFRVPDTVQSIPLTLEGLLAWLNFEPEVTANALPHPPGPHDPIGLTTPSTEQTAIEVPYGLILSPDASGRWEHSTSAVTRDGRTELWHTRLGSPDQGADDVMLRAVQHTHDEQTFSGVLGDSQGLSPPLTPEQRQAIAESSADFGADTPPRPLSARHFILSALGAWTDLSGEWESPPASLPGYRNVVTMGRDQYVRTVKKGFLYPWGHRASLVEIAERKLGATPSRERIAILGKRSFISVQQPLRTFEFENHTDLPLSSVRVPVLVNAEAPSAGTHVIRAHDGAPVSFALIGTDRDGQERHFSMPLLFVSGDELDSIAAIASEYEALVDQRTVDFRNQNVAFAPLRPEDRAVAGDGLGPTTLKTASMRFRATVDSGLDPPFRPHLEHAQVQVPAAEHLAGASSTSSLIRYHPTYVANNGFTGAEVWALLDSGPLVQLSAEKAGGLAAPNFRLSGLSRAHGAVPNADQLANGTLGTQIIDGLGGRLLGIIRLADIIEPPTRASELPKLSAGVTADAQEMSFEWTPRVKALGNGNPLRRTPLLTIKGTLRRPAGSTAGPPTVDITGTLGPFRIVFADVLEIEFDPLRFHTVTGGRPEFDADINTFNFTGNLAFVGKLANLLKEDPGHPAGGPRPPGSTPKPRFGSNELGPVVAVTPEGVTAGIAFGVPTVPLGAFTLQNLALSATLRLFFVNRPAEVTFALSSRENPFLVSYSLIGGGGFFALTARTAHSEEARGIELEAAFELGAVAALDFVVVRGEAQVMIAILFQLQHDKAVLTGYVRIFGALEVLQLITLSVHVYLALSYDGKVATGTAEVTLMVRVLLFSKSVTFRVTRSFSTEDVPLLKHTFASNVNDSDWQDYCEAFA